MPEKQTVKRARKAKRQGKSPSTQAGEFVREEFHHVREGKHGARSPEQVIAIGLSKARREGVKLPPPRKGTTSDETREAAARDYKQGQKGRHHTSPRRSRAMLKRLKREGHSAASTQAISAHAHQVAQKRSPAERRESALKAAHSRTHAERSQSARKAARTRASRSRTRASRSHARTPNSHAQTSRTHAHASRTH